MQVLYRITKTAKMLGISPTTLRRWTRLGKVPVVKTPTNRWFWTPEMVTQIRKEMGME